MTKDTRDLLSVLKGELEFLEKGGDRNPARAWRPHFVFQDSPTCLNSDSSREPRPCGDCTLMLLVQENCAKKKVPCRYISLNERGETIDSFYRYATAEELGATLRQWLKGTIGRLEQEKRNSAGAEEMLEVHVRATAVAGP